MQHWCSGEPASGFPGEIRHHTPEPCRAFVPIFSLQFNLNATLIPPAALFQRDLLHPVNLRFYWGVCARCTCVTNRWRVAAPTYSLCGCRQNPGWGRELTLRLKVRVWVRQGSALVDTWSGWSERLCGTSAQPSPPRRSLNGDLLLPESCKWEAEVDNRIPTAEVFFFSLLAHPNSLRILKMA